MTTNEAIALMRNGKEKLRKRIEFRKTLPNPQPMRDNIQRVEHIRDIERQTKASEIPEDAPF